MLSEACEEEWTVPTPCDYGACKKDCRAKRGEWADGRCSFSDTCTCTYRC